MNVSREEFERLSAKLGGCPLCGQSDVQLDIHPELKPEAVCNNCGISLQGETVDEVIENWNVTLRRLRAEGKDMIETERG
jgi:hypothetical protein